MTRAHVNDLGMPYSLTTMVPGFMQQDSMVTRIMAASPLRLRR